MTSPFRVVLLTVALVGGLLSPVAATAQTAEEGTGANITPVVNIPHEDGGSGSDIEFTTLTFAENDTRFGANPVDFDPGTAGLQRQFAFAGTTGNGLNIYDITVPDDTYRAAFYDCPANQGDPQVFVQGGKTYITYTFEDDGSARRVAQAPCLEDAGLPRNQEFTGTVVIDVSDPFSPRGVNAIPVVEGSHNGSVHPNGNFFYNSNSSLYDGTVLDGGLPGIEYYDISNIATQAPTRLGKLTLPPIPASLGTESHDITFNADGTRGYSAALSQGVIIDTTDPASPSIISNWVDPTINVWHQADPVTLGEGDAARTFVIVEDEVAGAIGVSGCPSGGVHVYEVTGAMEFAPVKVGYWNIDDVRPRALGGCTAHVFDIHPEQGIMTISYYMGGVRVVDLGDLIGVNVGAADNPLGDLNAAAGLQPLRQVGFHYFEDSNSWSAKTPQIEADGSFFLYSNDLNRGLDVYEYVPAAAGAAEVDAGTWMNPAEARVALAGVEIPAGYTPYCLLP